ncbi:MAG: UvrD-helicase domain-containing protein [Eubacteriales bacterium]|nr:UvrD-helicase domain-containing protein [Eubacteriales bacterium]
MDFSKLNNKQLEAVNTLEGPVLIIAGAGSGKTRTMTYRIANLIENGVKPYQIMALTFTNKAAREMKDRIEALVGDIAKDAWVGTFHSICMRILRRDIEKLGYERSFVIYDDDDKSKLLKEIYAELSYDEKRFTVKQMQRTISDAKNRLLDADSWFAESSKDYHSQRIHDVFVRYQKRLKMANALDFDDIITKTLELFYKEPSVLEHYRKRFLYLSVDEYQDTNFAQYELVRLLTKESKNLCVVGDDDQSIYGWRGADIRNILEFKKDFEGAKVIKLEQNYRSTSVILNAANDLISNNEGRMDKKLWTAEEGGEPIKFYEALDEKDEAAWTCERIQRLHKIEKLPYSEMCVLYRMHAQSRVLEEMLMRAGIPYKVFGGTRFYDRKEIRDALAYLRLVLNPQDDISLKRIINVPKRSIGDATLKTLEEAARDRDVPMYAVLHDLPENLSSRPQKCVNGFTEIINDLIVSKETMPLTEFVQYMLEKSGLLEQYENTNDEELITRHENLMEFLGAVQEFENLSDDKSLAAYMENVSLVTDLDMQTEQAQYVTLMTLHSAKGLEYDAVFISGLEEGLLPSRRAVEEDDRLEEERRLLYVGMTRAKRYLHLSLAMRRSLYNQIHINDRSRFLAEMPRDLMSNRLGKAKRKYFGEPEDPEDIYKRPEPQEPSISFGMPGIGQSLDKIPGVLKGFVPSAAKKAKVPTAVFKKGDRVLHKKFGEGTVRSVDGKGSDARITIFFTAYGEKQFALGIAPIAKIE